MVTYEILQQQIEATIWLLEHDTASSQNSEQLFSRLGKTCVALMQRELPPPKNHRNNPETYRAYQREYKRRMRSK